MAAKIAAGKKAPAGGRLQSGNLTKRQKEVLNDLEKLAKKLGMKVSSGRLLFAGLKLKGGRCSLRDEPWLVLDRFLPYQDQVDTFKQAFLDMVPSTGIPETMVKNLSKEVRELAALTVRATLLERAPEADDEDAGDALEAQDNLEAQDAGEALDTLDAEEAVEAADALEAEAW